MGQNLSRNLARHGVPVAIHNRTYSRTEAFMQQFGHEGDFAASKEVAEFVESIARPRPILMMVKAVCDRVDDLKPIGELLGA